MTEVKRHELSESEHFGITAAQAGLLRAKADVCDSQHALQQYQAQVEAAQKNLAMAQSRLDGAILQVAYARGEKSGNWQLSQDSTAIIGS